MACDDLELCDPSGVRGLRALAGSLVMGVLKNGYEAMFSKIISAYFQWRLELFVP